MLSEKAYTLIKELDRNKDTLPPYNTDLVTEISNEIRKLVDENQTDAQEEDNRTIGTGNVPSRIPAMKIRHSVIKRNVRCLLAYHYNRIQSLRTMRWEFGSILPPEIKANMNTTETEWFAKYSTNLAQYMRTIGEDGLNLAVDLSPPKSLYIEVKCLLDYGKFELNDGSVVLLKKDSRHYLPRSECEELIRQGVFQHIV